LAAVSILSAIRSGIGWYKMHAAVCEELKTGLIEFGGSAR
jgi:hypothetical protein